MMIYLITVLTEKTSCDRQAKHNVQVFRGTWWAPTSRCSLNDRNLITNDESVEMTTDKASLSEMQHLIVVLKGGHLCERQDLLIMYYNDLKEVSH